MLDITFLSQPIATLVGTVVGFGAVAYQTSRGFKNLIAAQDHRAVNEARARVHTNKRARAAKEEEELRRGRKFTAALHGAVDSLSQRFGGIVDSFASMLPKDRDQNAEGLPRAKQTTKITTRTIKYLIHKVQILYCQFLA